MSPLAHTREILVAPGVRCWSCGTENYPLPEGMPDRAEGVVISRDGAVAVVAIRGQLWTVSWWQLDCGHEYEARPGEWVREPDGRVRRYIYRKLGELDSMPPDSRDYWRRKYTWILERNSWP